MKIKNWHFIIEGPLVCFCVGFKSKYP